MSIPGAVVMALASAAVGWLLGGWLQLREHDTDEDDNEDDNDPD